VQDGPGHRAGSSALRVEEQQFLLDPKTAQAHATVLPQETPS